MFSGWKKAGATGKIYIYLREPYLIQWATFQLVIVRTRVIKSKLYGDFEFEAFYQSLISLDFILNVKKGFLWVETLYMNDQYDEEDTEKKSIIDFFS